MNLKGQSQKNNFIQSLVQFEIYNAAIYLETLGHIF